MKTKTVLLDVSDVFEREIEEVLGYHYKDLIMWATVRYSNGSGAMYTIPLHALAIRHKQVTV